MERFVVGTGRCGSTLLSTMLSHHPQALILSECIGALDRTSHLPSGTVTAAQLKRLLLASNPFVDMSLRRGSPDKEALLDAEAMRNTSPPALLIAALPFLTRTPEALFAELLAEVEHYPAQPIAAHYNQLFAWLQQKLGKTFWIERSGESTVYLPQLFDAFPDARYVHIHRHGPEVVMSMARHSYLSLVTSFFTTPVTPEELAQTEYGGKPVSAHDPISRRFTERPDIEDYAAYWNYQITMACRAFMRMRPEQLLQVRFEDLVADPRRVLQEIASFFEMPDAPDWIEHAAALVDPALIGNTLAALSPGDRARLDAACQPGELLLGRREHPWVFPLLDMVKQSGAQH